MNDPGQNEHYRVTLAMEVNLGHDVLLHGTDISVEAPTPQLAMFLAMQNGAAQVAEELEISKEELMMVLMGQTASLFQSMMQGMGIDPDAMKAKPGTKMPLCTCGHRIDHHDESSFCTVEGCGCKTYHPKGPA